MFKNPKNFSLIFGYGFDYKFLNFNDFFFISKIYTQSHTQTISFEFCWVLGLGLELGFFGFLGLDSGLVLGFLGLDSGLVLGFFWVFGFGLWVWTQTQRPKKNQAPNPNPNPKTQRNQVPNPNLKLGLGLGFGFGFESRPKSKPKTHVFWGKTSGHTQKFSKLFFILN